MKLPKLDPAELLEAVAKACAEEEGSSMSNIAHSERLARTLRRARRPAPVDVDGDEILARVVAKGICTVINGIIEQLERDLGNALANPEVLESAGLLLVTRAADIEKKQREDS